jgi:hypothetical protein
VDVEVPPFLVLEPSLVDPCPLLLSLVFGWINSPSEEAISLLLGPDVILIKSIFSK